MNDVAAKGPYQEIATKGTAIYDRIKPSFEPKENGKFMAIEVDSEKTYLGRTSAEALEKARTSNPGKIFYVVKVGFETAETLAHSLLSGS